MSEIEQAAAPEEPAEEELSLRDELEAAAAGIREREAEPAETPAAQPVEEKPGQARDASGKFAKPERPAETPPAAQQPPAAAPAASETPPTAPDDAERQFARALRDVIQPYMPLITAEGGTPERAVRDLLNSAYLLRAGTPEQKIALIQQTCRQFGVPLDRLAQPQPQVHPAISQLEGQIAELRQARQQEALYRQQQETAVLTSEIHSFSQAAGHEHFQAVKGDMAALLQSGLAQDLQDAYDRAIWARPDLRSTLLQQQQQTADQQRAAEAKAKAGAAKRAGASVTGAPGVGGSAPPPANRSLRDELMENLRAASGRV